MYKIFINLLVLTTILVVGCGENSLNVPVGTLEKNGNTPTREILNFNLVINDPIAGSSELVGTAYYTHEVANSNLQGNQFLVSVSIDMNSELNDMLGMMHLEWNSSGQSNESFYINEEGIYLLQKAYSITNRDDVMLIIQYLVTTEGMGISNVWMQLLD